MAGRAKGPYPELPGVDRGLPGRASWLGTLAPSAAIKDCRFVDGLLELLTLKEAAGRNEDRLSDARLATVRELRLAPRSRGRGVWRSGRLSSLLRVTGTATELAALGKGGPAQRLQRVRLVFDGTAEWNQGPELKPLPAARELLVGLNGDSGSASGNDASPRRPQPLAPRSVEEDFDRTPFDPVLPPRATQGRPRLTPYLVDGLEPRFADALDRGQYDALGLEVADATTEGIAAWLREASHRQTRYFVVHADDLISFDAPERVLRVGPYTQGKAFDRRLLLVAMLLRELQEVGLETVELDGPTGVDLLRYARKVVGPELRRRPEIRAFRVGSALVAP